MRNGGTTANCLAKATQSAPTGVTDTSGNGQATVIFIAPSSTGDSAIIGYTVTSSPGGFTGSAESSPIIVSGLTNGITYTFTVTATNSADTGSPSAASSKITIPYNLSVSISGTGGGSILSVPPDNSIVCLGGANICSSNYNTGTSVKLLAAAD